MKESNKRNERKTPENQPPKPPGPVRSQSVAPICWCEVPLAAGLREVRGRLMAILLLWGSLGWVVLDGAKTLW